MKDFRLSFFVTIFCLAFSGYWGMKTGMGAIPAIVLAIVLGVMEVSLSFDNAVVNASVLKDMDAKWQQIFLTVGILIAVFGMRLFFPVVIVSIATSLPMSDVVIMALEHPEEYSRHLAENHAGIAAFGGMFLLLVFFSFLFDENKELHWLGAMEEKLSHMGQHGASGIMLALMTLFGVYLWFPISDAMKLTVLGAGIGGVILFMMVKSLDSFFEKDGKQNPAVEVARRNGIAGFLYLEVLDASFSLDGVIGAFAITRDLVLIMLGLAIGAMFVRSLTVHLTRRGTLNEYVFLEHGAHYAIGVLAVIMLAGIIVHIPEIFTGLAGAALIALSFISSLRHKNPGQKTTD